MAEGVERLVGPSLLQLPWVRQLALIVTLAMAIAMGIVVALWSQEPNYVPIFPNLSTRESVAVTESLQASQTPFKIDPNTGSILVAADQIRDLRMRLGAEGLPIREQRGFEMLNEEQSLGTSQFIESARYTHALETELARSISGLRGVEKARVHLAVPKQSAFMRKQLKARASVLVKLFPGRVLDDMQVNAIVHMVASSVSNLEPGQITLIDQMGRLLSSPGGEQALAVSSKELEYTRRLEADLSQRVINLLEPIVGIGKVRAEVNAVLDFTQSESTQESFDPATRVIRSEQLNEQLSTGAAPVAGVPGALSNQPPESGTVTPPADSREAQAAKASNESRSEVRNFEIDRVISHTRRSTGIVQRFSAAIIIDERISQGPDGNPVPQPYTDDEKTRFTELAKQAIGYNVDRGDSIQLISSSFMIPVIEDLPDVPLWEEPWVMSLGKSALGGLFVLTLMFVFVRPMIRNLNTLPMFPALPSASDGTSGELGGGGQAAGGKSLSLENIKTSSYDEKIEMARGLMKEHPDRVSNLVKNWVADG